MKHSITLPYGFIVFFVITPAWSVTHIHQNVTATVVPEISITFAPGTYEIETKNLAGGSAPDTVIYVWGGFL